MSTKHAIVVGSGMGGLTSAVLLAMHGWTVEVHEQHFRPGGLLHRFFREGAPYDTGFHYCGGVERQDILGRCFKHLGVLDQITFQPLDPEGFDRIWVDDYEFRVPVGWDNYRDRLVAEFPHEKAGIDALFADMLRAIEEYGLYVFKTDVNVTEFLRWEGSALTEVILRHVSDPMLVAILCGQGVLYGVRPGEAPFGLHSVIMHHFVRGAHRVKGGGDRLAKVMVKRLKELGGTLTLRSRVKQILVEDRVAKGVLLDSGEERRGDLVISNMHPRVLLDHLPEGAIRKAYRSRVTGQRVGIAHLGVYCQVEGAVPCIGNANVYRHYGLDPERSHDPMTPDARPPFYFATAPNEALDDEARKKHDVVLMLLALDWEDVKRWQGSKTRERPAEYEAFKQAVQDRAVEALLEDFPALRGRIVRAESSTGLTTEHYTTSPRGAMYGHYHSVTQMGKYRPSQVIRIRNFFQVGQGVFTPGVLGATLSGYYGCGFWLGLDQLLAELEAA